MANDRYLAVAQLKASEKAKHVKDEDEFRTRSAMNVSSFFFKLNDPDYYSQKSNDSISLNLIQTEVQKNSQSSLRKYTAHNQL